MPQQSKQFAKQNDKIHLFFFIEVGKFFNQVYVKKKIKHEKL